MNDTQHGKSAVPLAVRPVRDAATLAVRLGLSAKVSAKGSFQELLATKASVEL